jgi:hypothetical protein
LKSFEENIAVTGYVKKAGIVDSPLFGSIKKIV